MNVHYAHAMHCKVKFLRLSNMIFISGYVGLVEVKTVKMMMSAVYANTTMEELNATSTGQVSNLKRFKVIWIIFKKRSSKGMEHNMAWVFLWSTIGKGLFWSWNVACWQWHNTIKMTPTIRKCKDKPLISPLQTFKNTNSWNLKIVTSSSVSCFMCAISETKAEIIP